nr:MAG TPA: Protein of unknown function (DUF494) [Caudoviricetes sp.]
MYSQFSMENHHVQENFEESEIRDAFTWCG